MADERDDFATRNCQIDIPDRCVAAFRRVEADGQITQFQITRTHHGGNRFSFHKLPFWQPSQTHDLTAALLFRSAKSRKSLAPNSTRSSYPTRKSRCRCHPIAF